MFFSTRHALIDLEDHFLRTNEITFQEAKKEKDGISSPRSVQKTKIVLLDGGELLLNSPSPDRHATANIIITSKKRQKQEQKFDGQWGGNDDCDYNDDQNVSEKITRCNSCID